jgi:hypothetical protein
LFRGKKEDGPLCWPSFHRFQVGGNYCGVVVEPLLPELPLAARFLCLRGLDVFPDVSPLADDPVPLGAPEAVSLESPVAGADCPLAAPVLASVPRPSVLLVALPLVLLVPLFWAPAAFWSLAVPVPPVVGAWPLLSFLLHATANASANASTPVVTIFPIQSSSLSFDFRSEMSCA